MRLCSKQVFVFFVWKQWHPGRIVDQSLLVFSLLPGLAAKLYTGTTPVVLDHAGSNNKQHSQLCPQRRWDERLLLNGQQSLLVLKIDFAWMRQMRENCSCCDGCIKTSISLSSLEGCTCSQEYAVNEMSEPNPPPPPPPKTTYIFMLNVAKQSEFPVSSFGVDERLERTIQLLNGHLLLGPLVYGRASTNTLHRPLETLSTTSSMRTVIGKRCHNHI